jgi:hypothetical protein
MMYILTLNGMRTFGVNPILKPCRLGPKRIISYNLGWGITQRNDKDPLNDAAHDSEAH